MSENTQNQNKNREAVKTESGGEQNRRNHRHRRPHHHGKGGAQQPKANGQAAVALTESNNASPDGKPTSAANSEGNGAAKNRQNRQHNEKKQNQNNRNRQGNQENRERRGNNAGGRNNGRHGLEKRPFDPYEKPSRDEIELSRLRAQIVLQSADGSVPTAYGEPSVPTKKETPTESAEIATAVASDEALLTPIPDEITPPPADQPRVEVIGIRFRASGKTYYFDPHGMQAKKGEFAIVETTRGPEFGEVALANTTVAESAVVSPLRPLLRMATAADIAHNEENREKEKQALEICREKIAAHKLEMKLIDAQYAFDNSKLLFYFAAEGRVDFRELVKDLASIFRTRIELRQIGIRDEAKMLGGIGACGRTLCCSTFLPDFAQVSIKMAKDQNLSLNTSKISGLCGRLMCCLRYESEVYAEEIRKTPSYDSLVRTEDGIGTVIGSNPLAGTVRVLLKDAPDTPPKQYHRDSVTVLPKERRGERGKAEKKENEG